MKAVASIVSVLILASTVSLIVRLYLLGLHRAYRAFFFFLIFFALQSLTPIALNRRSGAYQLVWLLTEPIDWAFYGWIVLELCSLVLKEYQGLYTVGRRSLIVAISVALLASGFSLFVPSHSTQQGRLMFYYYVAERAVYVSLVVFLLSILTLLMWYPITLKRNTIVHSLIFSIYFISNTAIFLLLTRDGFGMILIVGYAIQAVNLGALAGWLAMLSTAGEHLQQRLRPTWMPGREEELVSQLNSLNMALLRANQKGPLTSNRSREP